MRRKILVVGTGKSTAYLLDYLIQKAEAENLHITICDLNPEVLPDKIKLHNSCTILKLDILNDNDRSRAIEQSDIVISMLPARFHIKVAVDCIQFIKHLVTASYISDEIMALNQQAKEKGLIFMNEIGLDPGIDHMSAMQVIDNIRERGGKMILFESFTGGLVAPESDNNLWNYKFTWNPRNVVVAGQGGVAKFIQEGTYKYI
ncbi:MAG: saccharopine dehydrogenase C-terminal domain-containing protein, partial [Arenibacter sp.]